jgi:hypothetical protein
MSAQENLSRDAATDAVPGDGPLVLAGHAFASRLSWARASTARTS